MTVAYGEVFEAQVDDVYRALLTRYGFAVGEAFLGALGRVLGREASLVDAGMRRSLAAESHTHRRDLYAVVVRGGGAWRVLYELRDEDRDGTLDTLAVFSVISATGPGVPG